jgi:son of sevenless-like protein
MYDFHSDDPDHLPFSKNEVLEIVKQADNGWWAAFRKGGRVGWIPEAFVNTLSSEVAEKLRNTREELRIYEYDAEQLYTSAPTQRIYHLYDSGEISPSPPITWNRPNVHEDTRVRKSFLMTIDAIHRQSFAANLTRRGFRPLFWPHLPPPAEIAR